MYNRDDPFIYQVDMGLDLFGSHTTEYGLADNSYTIGIAAFKERITQKENHGEIDLTSDGVFDYAKETVELDDLFVIKASQYETTDS
jgi:hypothetical protein